MRTQLPTAKIFLESPNNSHAKDASANAKKRQAYYYNKGAIEKPKLEVGQTVRMKMNDDSDWRKTEIVRSLPYRSYELKTEDGQIYRRTSKHVRFSILSHRLL